MPCDLYEYFLGTDRRRPRLRPLSACLAALPVALALAGSVAPLPTLAQRPGGGGNHRLPHDGGGTLPAATPGHAMVLTYHNDNQ